MDAEEKIPAAPPWCRLMPESMDMRIYIEMEETFISFLALLGIPVRSQQNACTAGKCGWHGHMAYGISAISAMRYLWQKTIPCGKCCCGCWWHSTEWGIIPPKQSSWPVTLWWPGKYGIASPKWKWVRSGTAHLKIKLLFLPPSCSHFQFLLVFKLRRAELSYSSPG